MNNSLTHLTLKNKIIGCIIKSKFELNKRKVKEEGTGFKIVS